MSTTEQTPELPGSLAQHLREIGTGERPMPTSDAKRHHFIPQFLMRGFADPGSGGLLHKLDINSGQITELGPRGAAWERRFYRVQDDQGDYNNHLEGFLSLVESHAAESIRELERDPLALSDGDRVNISFFLALQDQRTPGGHSRMKQQLAASARLFLETHYENAQAFRNFYRQRIDKSKSTLRSRRSGRGR